jgi:hypothetical protein
MSMSTRVAVIGAELSALAPNSLQRTAIRQIDAFGRLAVPGMTLARRKASLYPRCEDCGQKVSANKKWCRTCNQVHLLELGEQITTQDLLDSVLARSAEPQKALDALRPYLKFDPQPLP